MSYNVVIEKPARKFIEKQSKEQQRRILQALYKLPYEGDIVPMKGKTDKFRLRIGEYRAVYSLQNNLLTVDALKVGPRGDVYKKEKERG